MARKLATLFEEGGEYFPVTQFVHPATCRDHFAAALNGTNAAAMRVLLGKMLEDGLEGLKNDPEVRQRWEEVFQRSDSLGTGEIACVMAGRAFAYDNTSGLPKTMSIAATNSPALAPLKALLWQKLGGSDTRHWNRQEQTPRKPPSKPKLATAKRKAKSATKAKRTAKVISLHPDSTPAE